MEVHYTKFKYFFTKEEWDIFKKDIAYIKKKSNIRQPVSIPYWGMHQLKSFKRKYPEAIIHNMFPWEESYLGSKEGRDYYSKLAKKVSERYTLSKNGNN
jgi:hypothetical protein